MDILFVNTLQRGCVMAFYEYCFNSDNLGCFERDLTGRYTCSNFEEFWILVLLTGKLTLLWR